MGGGRDGGADAHIDSGGAHERLVDWPGLLGA